MHDPHTNAALLDGRVSASAHRAMQSAFLWIVASLVTAVAILSLVWVVVVGSDREAGRMIATAQTGAGSLAVLVEGLAAAQARPRP